MRKRILLLLEEGSNHVASTVQHADPGRGCVRQLRETQHGRRGGRCRILLRDSRFSQRTCIWQTNGSSARTERRWTSFRGSIRCCPPRRRSISVSSCLCAVSIVRSFSRETGESERVTELDIRYMALAYDIEKNEIGVEHINRVPLLDVVSEEGP